MTDTSTQAWRHRAERAEDAIKRVRDLVDAWQISDQQLADAWIDDPTNAATMVLMAKATNHFGTQIIKALDGIGTTSARVRNTP